MILLQSQSDSGSQMILPIFLLILRIIGAFVCSSKAKELNRSTGGWGFFGFLMPIVAMIWVNCIKPKVVWDNNMEANQNINK